jgi:acetylglutamate kinase
MINSKVDTDVTEFSGHKKLLLIKLGGNALTEESALSDFVSAVTELNGMDFSLVITHGGGPQISTALEIAGIESKFIGGFRYTSKEATHIVKRVLCGEIQNSIVSALRSAGLKVESFCGDEIYKAAKKKMNIAGEIVDIGFVGEITDMYINEVVNALRDQNVVIVSAIGKDDNDDLYNLNADIGASALAWALGADELILLTNVVGVLSNWPDETSLLSEINLEQARNILKTADSGMIPKLESAIEAIENLVPLVRILDGRTADALLASRNKQVHVGTVVRA